MSFLLEIQPNQTLKFLDALIYGGQTVLIGIATVFAVLVIIMLTLFLFKLFFYDLTNQKSAAPVIVSEPEITAPEALSSSNDEIVAVIAAAIAAAESESRGAQFRVVSFRRK